MSAHRDESVAFGVTSTVFPHSGPGTTCSETVRCSLKFRLLNLITDLIQYGGGGARDTYFSPFLGLYAQ